MEDIYTQISNYFSNEASLVDEKAVSEFKKKNPIEFELLASLWKRDSIEVIDFDTQKAWNNISNRPSKNIQPIDKKIFRFPKGLKIAVSIAAIFLIGLFVINYNSLPTSTDSLYQICTTNETNKTKLIELADGTMVWLNRHATLKYPAEFAENRREVSLDGEAFFDVSKNPNKPFIIKTNEAKTEVLGTSFSVNSTKKNTTVNVATGKVKVNTKDGTEFGLVLPNQTASVNTIGVSVFETLNKNAFSWKTGYFIFEEADLRQVINDLNTYYDKSVTIHEESNAACKFTGNFENNSLRDILEVMQITCDFKLVENKNGYLIK